MAKRQPKPHERRSLISEYQENPRYNKDRRSNKQAHNLQLVHSADANADAEQGRTRTFHVKDLAKIAMKNDNQHLSYRIWHKDNKNLVMCGAAGTGKSFLALHFGLSLVLDPSTEYDKLVIIRSVVPSREIGHLPGDKNEKIEEYEKPYHKLFADCFGGLKTAYTHLKKREIVEFECTSFLRGVTIDNAIVVVDEFQNMNDGELATIVTRLGENARIIFAGDTKQNDLTYKSKDSSGFAPFVRTIECMKQDFGMVKFGIDDIVRSGLVKNFLATRELLGL